ncbi:DUF2269 domain-containing protein [Undibacterium cyanobacteriorum]|uniref:DUF2269 domain-containing protein n=1 Tax=Undibacterium cyanobacteriorum TaxID=3073561 RepID=A0ABY9RMT0_9BURK|nr:DUF2269 domain-containing protein [Undibacterium sp. 20NA77.5]WMW82508.1 DUF2269 domain-containing protein [Undibacterium sp. 20NA77.5]
MNTYLFIKTIHILSSVILVGTGFGSAFYLFFAHRSRNLEAIAVVTRLVVRADWWLTTPTIILQPLSGMALMYLAGWTFDARWIQTSVILYVLAGLCWLPVVWIQIQLRNLSTNALTSGKPLSVKYWKLAKYWEMLGYPAFLAMLIIYFLMTNKPQ